MPASIGVGTYIKFATLSLLTMLAGAQIVHQYYQPLSDLDEYINRERKSRTTAKDSK